MQLNGNRVLLKVVAFSLIVLGASTLPQFAFAQAPESSSFIEQVKKSFSEELPQKSEDGSYTERLKKELSPAETQEQSSYLERLKSEDPTLQSPDSPTSYTQLEKSKLEPEDKGGAIESTLKGDSTLRVNHKPGVISGLMGLKYGLDVKRNFSLQSGNATTQFSQIYNTRSAHEISFFYEYQFFHSEIFGSLGLYTQAGVGYFSGKGQVLYPSTNPGTSLPYPNLSKTDFSYFSIPLTLAASYRFNLLHYLRPFILAGPSAIGYLETRNDDQDNRYGYTVGAYGALGVSILLDGLSRASSWDLFLLHKIHHLYINVEYSRFAPLTGPVRLVYDGIYAGLSFEY